MGWEAIKGQDRVITLLRRAIERERLPHAYLFLGPEGVGKKLAALALAQVVNCAEAGTDFCGRCPSCRKISKGLHPDVVLLEPQEGGSIKIEHIRRLQQEIAYKPFEGRVKVWIIDQAERLTLQAANCLLKTLEEPPAHSLLILVAAQAAALLPTVVSRCQQVNFLRLKPPVLKQLLLAQGIAPEALELGVALAEGGLARVSQGQLEEFWAQREEILEYLQGRRNKFSDVFALGNKLSKQKEQIEQLVRLFSLWYRDLLLLKLGMGSDLLVNQDKFAQLSQQAERMGLSSIQQRLGLIQESFSALRYNANPRLVLEEVLLQLNTKGGTA